ncbi:MAG: 2-oxoglutarate carboxylase small subunit [Moraxellaceae bacterium]|jgi:urea carboxylase|nr:2-oxoglutarate carboxylase small subunit [Moraxellaceae bacterium]
MFKKVLIANRGAIACRVIRTLRTLGVQSVAVFSEADADSLHVSLADEAVCIGPAPAAESYLRADKILEVAKATGAEAIHPGYGFLSENPDFCAACEAAGIAFIGPTPEQMLAFGLKHTARDLAEQSKVPLLPGSGLLAGAEEAHAEAARIGYPVMLKSTAGGGGIGMRLIWSAGELDEAWASVERLARANFKEAGIYLEKYVQAARHIEVQVFGDGKGGVLALGERDCSVQRRNQKVIEETPAPGLNMAQREALHGTAVRLMEACQYRSAGTVEFVMDADTGAFYFLEVNTRLQVEHGVTEEVSGVDLVGWMVSLAAGDLPALDSLKPELKGASIQVRLYAEDPARNFQPSSGVLTEVQFAKDARIETAVVTGSSVPPFYDPMVAKIIVNGADREEARAKLAAALAETRISGIETNLEYLRTIVDDVVFREGRQTTRYLNTLAYTPSTIEVLEGGVQTSVQDWPARVGYWDVGVPPSGPMDPLAFRLGNRLVGNDADAAGLEITMTGPVLRFNVDAVVAVTGAPLPLTLDGVTVPLWQAVTVKAGSTLALGAISEGGCRSYLTIAGGLDVPAYLGSRSTFTLGQFGGHAGRNLRLGDVLHLGTAPVMDAATLPASLVPQYPREWQVGVLYGPHGAPDFFTDDDIATFFATDWEVHYNSSRTGVRLIGPKPAWARRDGGEAGLHPSNIHDNAYAIGAIDFTGDMPVILGPDGPSLGGFVCPAVVVNAELWKLGQLRPGDKVRFVRLTAADAARLEAAQEVAIATLDHPPVPALASTATGLESPVLAILPEKGERPQVVYRQAGDRYLLVEYGPLALDLNLRFRVHALMQWLQANRLPGILDLTPGIRSLQIHFDSRLLPRERLLRELALAETELPAVADMVVPTRTVWLPLSWDDAATKLAIEKYMQSVRKDAPWCPSNIEFIRRINGLENLDEVMRVVFEASYLVLGLGDVYLGAPVATPVDPRHRLVTTKYNPARTWTPENAVGIGGAYMCVYGMEGPGGYQFVGRTVQMWNRHRVTRDFEAGKPWLLRFFDQVRFYPVSESELLEMRRDFISGRFQLRIEEGTFSLADYQKFLGDNAESIGAFKATQQAAFDAERERWRATGQAEYISESAVMTATEEVDLPEGARLVAAHVPGNIWQLQVKAGDKVKKGDVLVIIESMKMEFNVHAPCDGEVHAVLAAEGSQVGAGVDLLVLKEG